MTSLRFGLLLSVLALGSTSRAETVYVSDEQADVIHVIEPPALDVAARIPVGRRPRGHSQVANHEHNAREKLAEDDPEMVADKIGRAYGVLRHAHIIDSKEALNHLSLLRLGGILGFFPAETVILCDTLLMDIQPAHLQLHSGKKLTPEERDAIRAEIVRSRLHSLVSPDNRSTSQETKPISDNSNPGDA